MIYQMKIFRPNGTLRKVIPPEKLEKDYWKRFQLNNGHRQRQKQALKNARKFSTEKSTDLCVECKKPCPRKKTTRKYWTPCGKEVNRRRARERDKKLRAGKKAMRKGGERDG